MSELVGDRYVVAQVRRDEGRFTLIIDADWIELAKSLVNSRQDLIEVDDLPRSVLLAVVAGWPDDWVSTDEPVDVQLADDGVPHLRLIANRVQSA